MGRMGKIIGCRSSPKAGGATGASETIMFGLADRGEWRCIPCSLSVLFGGIVMTGVTYYLQAWIIEKKGPIFYGATTPLPFIFTLFVFAFFLVEINSLDR